MERWARYAMDVNYKANLVVNNTSEVSNMMILDVRGKPVRTMFEGIRNKIRSKCETKISSAAAARWVSPLLTLKSLNKLTNGAHITMQRK
jgi:hypothetical protein